MFCALTGTIVNLLQVEVKMVCSMNISFLFECENLKSIMNAER